MSDFTFFDAVAEPPAQTLSVLLLDDSDVMLDLVGDMLHQQGIAEVLTAADGEQGLALFNSRETKPDILMCDLRMPGMDGIEFLRHVAASGYAGGVILLSGADAMVLKATERLAHAHGLNILGVLEKPVEEQALAELLARRHEQRAQPARSRAPVQLLTPEELREGLDGDYIELFFQPKVATRERKLVAVECLARWRHPQRGLLTPDAFISVVELHGMIDEFTLAVFRKAVAQQAVWLKQGHDIRIAVNLSMDNLLRLDLPEILEGIVHAAGLPAYNIVLEMTESRLVANIALSLEILIRLRMKGFALSIDDFGTGYSTMESLKQLPFTELKVDRCFVHGAAQDAAAMAILGSSVYLGKTFNLNLVAEGVETQEDWDTVVASECDEVQGYFISKPMPGDSLVSWKNRWEGVSESQSEEHRAGQANILVVDDDATMLEMFDAVLGGNFRIDAVASGEEALAAAARQRPDLILLDVEMPPGIDGYETCRRLKEADATADVPVIFVSGRDCLEDRLKGYEAGGEDYITKPFDAPELEAKVLHLLKTLAERSGLKQMSATATSTAMTAMTSMSEMGVLLESLKHFNACDSYPALADAILGGLALFGLHGVAQVRTPQGTVTRTEKGDASPLEASVINHMASMERIVQFKSRMSISYERVTLLVNDMPTEDPDRCGRLRDHLATLAESAEAGARAIAVAAESRLRGVGIDRAVGRITATLSEIDQTQREYQINSRLAVEMLTQRMESAYLSVALSDAQEEFMARILSEGLEHLLSIQSEAFSVQNKLSSIVQELKGMSGPQV